jgi:hypothetical protein
MVSPKSKGETNDGLNCFAQEARFAIEIGFFSVTMDWSVLVSFMKFFRQFLGRRWSGAMLALLAAWLAPSRAQAGCGDYVVIPGEHQPMPENRESIPNQPRQPFSPCTSATCMPPSDMALAGSSSSVEEVNPPASSNQDRCYLFQPEHPLPIPIDFHGIQGSRQSIFHPPRS